MVQKDDLINRSKEICGPSRQSIHCEGILRSFGIRITEAIWYMNEEQADMGR